MLRLLLINLRLTTLGRKHIFFIVVTASAGRGLTCCWLHVLPVAYKHPPVFTDDPPPHRVCFVSFVALSLSPSSFYQQNTTTHDRHNNKQEAIKSALMGIGIHLQATDQGELELEYIKSQVQKV